MNINKLKSEFPQMPESFKNKVEQTVFNQTRKYSEAEIRHKRFSKRAIPAICAIVILSGATAYAVGMKLLPNLDKANENAPALIQNDINAINSQSEKQAGTYIGETATTPQSTYALLSVDEALFDGIMLHIYATETDEGAKYTLIADDIKVNGNKIPLDIFRATDDGYYIMANTSDLTLPAEFEVTLPVLVYEKHDPNIAYPIGEDIPETKQYETQEYSFTINNKSALTDVTDKITTKKIDGEDFNVDIKELSFAPTATKIKFDINFTGNDAQSKAKAYSDFLMSATAGDETLYSGENKDSIAGFSGNLQQTQDGYTLKDAEWVFRAFSDEKSINEITIVPYANSGEDREMKTDYDFTIKF